ncbi:MAG TPA: hypothetical protein VMS21_05925 [Methylomirabilota bacterium]|nr:hypothetical protein [Methylomirabilota bacterium]
MARFFPLSGRKAQHRRRETMRLRTSFGVVVLRVWRGKDPVSGRWGIPIRQRWSLSAHQQLSPAMEEKLAYFATVTGSYEVASQLARKVGLAVEDSTVHALVQRQGARAEQQTRARLRTVPREKAPARAPTPLGVLMIDGFMVRYRGPGWGRRKTAHWRVEWHEEKIGVFYRHEQASRGGLAEKVVVSLRAEPAELGERLHWEAVRAGLGRAREILVLGDGAAWIWNLARDRWSQAHQLLDFYHGSQHLWALGQALHPRDSERKQQWTEKGLHGLRHGKQQRVLREIAALPRQRGQWGKVIRAEQDYFAGQAGRMNYAGVAARGWPIGSGAVESACRQKQCRFKRPGQFWSEKGMRHLNALIEARQNDHWDELWLSA